MSIHTRTLLQGIIVGLVVVTLLELGFDMPRFASGIGIGLLTGLWVVKRRRRLEREST